MSSQITYVQSRDILPLAHFQNTCVQSFGHHRPLRLLTNHLFKQKQYLTVSFHLCIAKSTRLTFGFRNTHLALLCLIRASSAHIECTNWSKNTRIKLGIENEKINAATDYALTRLTASMMRRNIQHLPRWEIYHCMVCVGHKCCRYAYSEWTR